MTCLNEKILGGRERPLGEEELYSLSNKLSDENNINCKADLDFDLL